jgi:putative transposase
MSDVMHGPSVVVGERVKRKTYLIAFIDDATRVIPHAAFALSENTQTFLPVLKLAIEKRGLPQRLYVDNGANYRSRHLALVCAKLGIALIHARPYRPQGKGKIERWFKSVRAQAAHAPHERGHRQPGGAQPAPGGLDRGRVSPQPHRGLDGVTPLEQWARPATTCASRSRAWTWPMLFLFEAERKVQKDRTVSLNGVVYEVDAALVGEKVTLRFDPWRTARAPRPGLPCGQAHRAGPPGADLCQLFRQTRSAVLDLECRRPGPAAAALGAAPA